jgi:TolB-like protein/DNA-binding winged helix-turn-helix (wHTH) protein/tetratricopeptide (TPR) repeat protein
MRPDSSQSNSIRFGRFELRLQSDELHCEDTPVKLPPQPYKVLRFLVENAGRLVTRKELKDKIWGPETFVDFDKGLNLCIAQIREALGDNALAPSYVETLSRRGYRFIAVVESEIEIEPERVDRVAGEAATASDLDRGSLIGRLRNSAIKPALFKILIPILLVCATASFFFFRMNSGSSGAETKSMLLVLPLENLTNDPAEDYFSDGLTEELITRLGSLQPRSLGVIARTTALKYKKTGKDIRQIGDELGVNYVLEGSVRREAGRVRITSQLIQVKDQTHLWAETFDRDETDVLNIQREVATQVASALRFELLPGSYSEAAGKKAKPEAFDAYLKGRFLITKDNQEDLVRSIPYFDQAIVMDPDFAPAYAAEVEGLVLQYDATGALRELRVQKAKAAALKAVELDSSYSESYAALGSVQLFLEWDPRSAEVNFKRAVELNPNNPLTRINYGRCLLAKGDTALAVSEIDEALKLDPVGLLTTGLAAFARLQVGHYDEAITLSNRMIELEPKSWAARECLFRSYINQGNYSEALRITRERMLQGGAKPEEIALLDKGDPKEILEKEFRKNLAQMREAVGKGEEVWTMYGAWLSVKLGDKEQAFEWLNKAASDHGSFLVYLDVDPIWNPLRSDPRFDNLKRRIAL